MRGGSLVDTISAAEHHLSLVASHSYTADAPVERKAPHLPLPPATFGSTVAMRLSTPLLASTASAISFPSLPNLPRSLHLPELDASLSALARRIPVPTVFQRKDGGSGSDGSYPTI